MKPSNMRQLWRHRKEDLTQLLSHGDWWKVFVAAIGVYLLVAVGLGMYWSTKPDDFDVVEVTLSQYQSPQPSLATGTVTTATTLAIVDTLLNKPGGFIGNDTLPPGVWLDNMPNWEYGVVQQLRDMSKSLRESFSRSQSQSAENADLAKADSRFNFSTENWLLPSSESMYHQGYDSLQQYFEAIADPSAPQAQFYARADNLNDWLEMVSKRLGSMSQQLSASVGQKRINTDLAGDTSASQSTPVAPQLHVKTPWHQVDDVFFQARGTTWALLHLLKAVEVDFATVLDKKNATASLQQIIRELELAQQPYHAPIVLNGGGFGMMANHSLVMASYIARANAGVIELRHLLAQG